MALEISELTSSLEDLFPGEWSDELKEACRKFQNVKGCKSHFLVYEVFGALQKFEEDVVLSDLSNYVDLRNWTSHEEPMNLEDKFCRKRLEKPSNTIKGLYSCKKCGNDEFETDEKQTRSGDEGQTLFIKCSKCFTRRKV